MYTFDLSRLPALLTDQRWGIDDETQADHAFRARLLDALYVALLPIGMRVICLETVGIVTGWDASPSGRPGRVPFLSRTVPHAFAPEQAFSPASSTYLPALRARLIVDAATIPHFCKLIAESMGWKVLPGESFGIRHNAGRWFVASTHGGKWHLGPYTPTATREDVVIATLQAQIAEIATVYEGREPASIGAAS